VCSLSNIGCPIKNETIYEREGVEQNKNVRLIFRTHTHRGSQWRLRVDSSSCETRATIQRLRLTPKFPSPHAKVPFHLESIYQSTASSPFQINKSPMVLFRANMGMSKLTEPVVCEKVSGHFCGMRTCIIDMKHHFLWSCSLPPERNHLDMARGFHL
jgi:hypothetical protein